MVREMAPARRRRLNAHGMILRRGRIFARLREGLNYEEIATEEGLSGSRIRQIVTEALQKKAVDSGADHAKLQVDRLAPVMQVAAEAVAAGDVSAITPYLKVLDRLDLYQTAASAHQVYDDEARKKLLDKINRVAANVGVDEAFHAAAIAHLKKQARSWTRQKKRRERKRKRQSWTRRKTTGQALGTFRPAPDGAAIFFT